MKNYKLTKTFKNLFISLLIVNSTLFAANIEKIHFLIPGGAGGGWDGTARGVGEALLKSNLIKEASYENISGGGGGKAIAYLIETANKQQNTIMVNSTPIVIRSLQGIFPQSFRDLSLISTVIADFGVLVVKNDSKYNSWEDVKKAFKKNPGKIKIAGGSSRGSMDHLVAAQIFKAANGNPRDVRYVPYNAGGKAIAGLLTGEVDILSTGLGEVLEKHKKKELKIIGVTSNKSIEGIPSFKSMGVDAYFVNWRGFFAAPNLPKKKIDEFAKILEDMYKTEEWEKIRKRNGWENLYKSKEEFKLFLENQEKIISSLMKEMGFL
ncbi:tripartite tricarboxylate transporter substrate binding protein [Malaciobacter mytili]|uniref:Tripartite tricarboxylate transporter substrate-binding protein n=1 Tax=Malaciobacter mytili LMG 24559 TaxID=1032238 RepID=A0AAX2AHN6_9BACT|nr:tripartite tricarboxylate transporter substrate-binding protein [Malaciobacter mytili]AXH13802.1 tripartite tricarboxylate transport protein TctABC, extracytoplasmic tricarboxylate-binding receptor TctC [Malaciobacter mytili LMG 24559]RXK15543.1 tripartite tricarboxylate transporter substrate-binding protein [Malaciobacter mytili LMG 24559]